MSYTIQYGQPQVVKVDVVRVTMTASASASWHHMEFTELSDFVPEVVHRRLFVRRCGIGGDAVQGTLCTRHQQGKQGPVRNSRCFPSANQITWSCNWQARKFASVQRHPRV